MAERKKSTKPEILTKPKKKFSALRFFSRFKLIVRIFIILLIIGAVSAGSYAVYNWYRTFTAQKFQAFSSLVTGEIINCAELTAVKYNYSEIVSLRKSALMGLAKSYSLVRFSGSVRAGIIDMREATIEISADKKSIFVVLPPTRIISNDVVSQEVFDEAQSIFVPIRVQEIFTEIDNARAKKITVLLEEGFLLEAQQRAEQLVGRILSAMGFEQIRVQSRL